MATLSAHLRQTEGHARLPFHPACPICRSERLSGELPSDSLVSRRTQAAIAAGLLAFSSVAPGAMAAEPDRSTEGTAAPGQVIGGGSQSPDFDPGGESEDLPVEAPPQVPAPADAGEPEPLEAEPVIDDAPVAARGGDGATVGSGDGATVGGDDGPTVGSGDRATAGEEPLPTAPVDEPVPAEAGEAPAEPETTRSAVTQPSGGARSDGSARRSTPRPVTRTVTHRPGTVPAHVVPHVRPTGPTRTVAATVKVAAAPPTRRVPRPTVVVSGTQTGRAQPGDRFHVVRSGESLWSIAADVLGDDTTVARIAREVNRLWQLNDERIATGDRNLLLVGTRLRLT